MKEYFIIDLFILFLIFSVSNCRFYSYPESAVPRANPRVSVTNFGNDEKALGVGLNLKLTEALKEKLRKDVYIDLVEDKGEIQISGRIKSYTVSPFSIGANNKVYLNRVEIKLDASRISTDEKDTIFKKDLNAFVDYNAELNYGAVKDSIQTLLAVRMADRIYYEFFTHW